jgi:general secretion pathway protein E
VSQRGILRVCFVTSRSQVQAAIGFDFPHALRSILRQDPDIIMIGEIRDLETARIAIQSSLTGHLVLSTLHTNSAAAAITRLVDMGVENYLLASTLKGVLAQRLVRTLCVRCAVEHDRVAYWAEEFSRNVRDLEALGPASIKQARGCAECHGTGFSGRSTIVEIRLVDSHLHRLILSNASDSEIQALGSFAVARGCVADGTGCD